ncbi:MAG: type IV pilus secretin PilQ [Pseudomonadaceae bacterium]|nr:type IV pilus secretin PilQ [Pseudomonadaceae bacterium]
MTANSNSKTWLLASLIMGLLTLGVFTPLTALANTQLVGLDFQRTQQGNARILIDFSTLATLPSAEQTSQGLRLKFTATEINSNLINLYDTNDFATQVSQLELFQTGTRAELLVQVEGEFNYLFNTKDNQLQIEIAAKAGLQTGSEPENNNRLFRYTGELISLSYHDIPLRDLLAELAAFLGLNLITDDSVKGNATLHLEQVPSDQALDMLLISQGLASRQQGKILLVAPAESLIKLEEQQYQAHQSAAKTGPLEDAFIKINYANAKDLQIFILGDQKTSTPESSSNMGALLLGSLPLPKLSPETEKTIENTRRFLSDRGHLLVDERTNTLYVRDTKEQVARIKSIVQTLDVPIDQVMIEARIVVARTGVSDELGVSWGVSNVSTPQSSNLISERKVNKGAISNESLLTGSRGSSIDFNPLGGASLGFVSNKLLLDLELKVLETENRSEVISQPKVITSNRNKAVIRSGEEIPYQSSPDKDGVTTTNFRNAELRLEVTPQIVGDGRIFLSLKVNNDSKGEETQGAGPTINTNAVETQVLVNNGETIVIGGIFTSQKINYEAKVPFLGDLPLIGWLFRNSISSQEKVELLVFITPRMINNTLAKK